VFGSDGFIYALSTAPGLRDIPIGVPAPHAVYRSHDGLAWTTESISGLGEDLYPRDIAQAGSYLYLVGTAPSARNPAAAVVRVGSSDDAGHSWQTADLELLSEGDVFAGWMHVDVASSTLGTMVGASLSTWVDDVGQADITLFAGSEIADLQAAVIPFGEGYSLERVEATNAMYYAIARPTGGLAGEIMQLELWRSPDGRDWEKLEGFPFLETVAAFGEVGNYRVVVGQLEGRTVVGASTDDLSWDEVDLSELMPTAAGGGQWISAAGIGAAGLYINVQSFISVGGREELHEVSQLIESADLRSWSSTATVNLIQGYVEQVVVGDDFVFVNGISGVPGTRVHLIGTLG
jgi:hypothetical protein